MSWLYTAAGLRHAAGQAGQEGWQAGRFAGPVVSIAKSLPVVPVDTPHVCPCEDHAMRRAHRSPAIRIAALRGRAISLRHQAAACVALAAGATGLTGCQVDVGGQTLPSAYYLQDDIQYFPAGPEFKLSKEAAAQKAYKKEIGADGCGDNCGGCSHCGH
jgi:hypothetical protein